MFGIENQQNLVEKADRDYEKFPFWFSSWFDPRLGKGKISKLEFFFETMNDSYYTKKVQTQKTTEYFINTLVFLIVCSRVRGP